MPVARLLAEGRDLDAVVLGAICQGNPVVSGGSTFEAQRISAAQSIAQGAPEPAPDSGSGLDPG
ncbi:MAG: hypothetical protein ACHRXM_01285 [Isosphaerales bacterium]